MLSNHPLFSLPHAKDVWPPLNSRTQNQSPGFSLLLTGYIVSLPGEEILKTRNLKLAPWDPESCESYIKYIVTLMANGFKHSRDSGPWWCVGNTPNVNINENKYYQWLFFPFQPESPWYIIPSNPLLPGVVGVGVGEVTLVEGSGSETP